MPDPRHPRPAALFDPGLQPERTRLAWRRTVLSLVVATLVALRLLPHLIGYWSAPVVLALAGTAGGVGWAAANRSRRVHRALADGTGSLPGGGLLLAMAAITALLSAVGLGYVAGVVAGG